MIQFFLGGGGFRDRNIVIIVSSSPTGAEKNTRLYTFNLVWDLSQITVLQYCVVSTKSRVSFIKRTGSVKKLNSNYDGKNMGLAGYSLDCLTST